MRVVGIDPGLSGALAVLDGGRMPTVVDAVDMPVFSEKKPGGGVRRTLDCLALVEFLRRATDGGAEACVLERVAAMPRQGVSSTFRFGEAFGAAQAAVAAAGLPLVLVTPAEWKRAFRLSGDKEASRKVASQLMPSGSGFWRLKKQDGRAEAALMALWWMRKETTDGSEA